MIFGRRNHLQLSMNIKKKQINWLEIGLIILLGLISLFIIPPVVDSVSRLPIRDPGTFLYTGSSILEGKLPYRDIWDYHPPLIHFIYAFAIWLGGNGLSGLGIFAYIAVLTFGLLVMRFLYRYFGWIPAVFGAFGAIFSLTIYQNFCALPEFYALPLQSAILLLAADLENRPRRNGALFAVGLLTGLLSSLRLTLSGVGLVVVLYLFIIWVERKDWHGIISLLWVSVGIGLVWGAWFILFASQNALPAFVDQVFRFVTAYYRVSNLQRLGVLLNLFDTLFHRLPFYTLGLVAWFAVFPFLFSKESGLRRLASGKIMGALVALAAVGMLFNGAYNDVTHRLFTLSDLSAYRLFLIMIGLLLLAGSVFIFQGRLRSLLDHRFGASDDLGLRFPLYVALVGLPLEVLFASLPGQDQLAFALPFIPFLSILLGWLLWSFLPSSGDAKDPWVTKICLAGLGAVLLISNITAVVYPPAPPQKGEMQRMQQLQAFFQTHATPGTTILQWNSQPQIYPLTHTHSTSLFSDVMPLFIPGYTSNEKIERFLSELQSAPPEFIVDSQNFSYPLLLTRNRDECDQLLSESFLISLQEIDRFRWEDRLGARPFVPVEMRPVYQWVCKNYEVAGELTPGKNFKTWFILRLRQAAP